MIIQRDASGREILLLARFLDTGAYHLLLRWIVVTRRVATNQRT